MKLFLKYGEQFPFEKIVTHRYKLQEAETALKKSMDVGCCLRCVFCWVDWSRDYPERYGKLYTPEEVAKHLTSVAKAKGVMKLRISGGEPTLGKEHLLDVLDRVDKSPYLFILESNGILLGSDEEYTKALARYRNVHIRVSIKAGTEEGFQKRTGALGRFVYLPFQAVRNLKRAGVSFHVAVMSDSRLMSSLVRCIITLDVFEKEMGSLRALLINLVLLRAILTGLQKSRRTGLFCTNGKIQKKVPGKLPKTFLNPGFYRLASALWQIPWPNDV